MTLNEEITRLEAAKPAIRASIQAKGVTIPESATLDQYPQYIDKIKGGGKMLKVVSRKVNLPPGVWRPIGSYYAYAVSVIDEGVLQDAIISPAPANYGNGADYKAFFDHSFTIQEVDPGSSQIVFVVKSVPDRTTEVIVHFFLEVDAV